MNYGNSCGNNCEICFHQGMNQGPHPFTCCFAQMPHSVQAEPLYPVDPNRASIRKSTKVHKKNCSTLAKPLVVKKRATEKCSKPPLNDLSEICQALESSHQRNAMVNPKNSKLHPKDCCCVDCDNENDDEMDEDCKQKKNSKTKLSKQGSCSTMVNSTTEKCLKNYLYDNPELKESKSKKKCVELDDDSGSDNEVWLLQCPKNFDPETLLSCELGKMAKQSSNNHPMKCTADRFNDRKTLAVIAPEKADEYQLICDNLKLVKPIGKIVVSESFDSGADFSSKKNSKKHLSNVPTSESNSYCNTDADSNDMQDDDDDECNNSDQDVKPLAGKKMQKKLNDQRFTIETTVTVQKCGNERKKGKKSGMSSDSKCLPFVPQEPSPLKKKKKMSKRDDELGCCS